MSTKANNFKLGLFILIGMALGAGGLVLFGLGTAFHRKLVMETYLAESVQGLEVGSKVKFRGVTVGNVKRISFSNLKYEQNLPPIQRHRYVLIEMDIDHEQFTADPRINLHEFLQQEVQRGLRIRLASQGITGLAYLEIDYLDPQKFPPLAISWTPTDYYLPSATSTVTRFINAAENVFDKLYRIDLEALATNLTRVVGLTQRKLEEIDAAGLSRNANQFLDEVRQTTQDLRRSLDDLHLEDISTNLVSVLNRGRVWAESGRVEQIFSRLQQLLQRLDRIATGSEFNLTQTFDHLRALTENLRELTENAKRNPSQLLFGEPPPAIKLKP